MAPPVSTGGAMRFILAVGKFELGLGIGAL